jgi:hypothetical protein
VDKIRRNISASEGHLLRFASNVVRSAWLSPVDPERLWLGTWNEDTLWRVCIGSDHSSTMDERIPPEELMKLRKIVKDLTTPLINAVRALWTARGAKLHPNSPSMSRLLIPTRRPQGPSSGAAPKEKPSHSIDKNTVVMESTTNRSKRKHASHSSDPPPQAKAATQMYFTAYTRRTGQQKPSTVLSSTFPTSERLTSSRGSSSTGSQIYGSPAALPQSHQETKPTESLGVIASTGKRAREQSTTTAQPRKQTQQPVRFSHSVGIGKRARDPPTATPQSIKKPNISNGKRAREWSATTTQPPKQTKLTAYPVGTLTGGLSPPYTFSQTPDMYPDS